MFVYTIQPVVKPVVKRIDNRLNEELFVQHGCQTGLYRANGVLDRMIYVRGTGDAV